MRELTLEELELVAGGTDTIVVTGDRGDSGDWGDYGDDSSWYDSGDYGDGGGGGGSDTGSENEDFTVTNDDAPCEDGAAIKAGVQISNLVQTIGNYEFTGVLARNADGTFGLLNNELSTMYSSTNSTFDREDFTNAYGVVHNHPFNDSDYLDNFQQRYPSTADWQSLDELIAGGADPAHLSVFILDPFGDMREFKYSDRALYEGMSDTQRGQGQNLPPETQGCS